MLAETDGHPGEYEAILERFREGNATRVLEAYPEAPDVLQALRSRAGRVGICSNWGWDLAGAADGVGLARRLHTSGPGAGSGARKTPPRIFEQPLATMR